MGENSSDTTEEVKVGTRHLYVPYHDQWDDDQQKRVWQTSISWDAQLQSGIKLFKLGYYVQVHRHGRGASCLPMSSPVGGCVEIDWTEDNRDATVVPVIGDSESETESNPET